MPEKPKPDDATAGGVPSRLDAAVRPPAAGGRTATPPPPPPPADLDDEDDFGADLDRRLAEQASAVVDDDLVPTDVVDRSSAVYGMRVSLRHHKRITDTANAIVSRTGISKRTFDELVVGLVWEHRVALFQQAQQMARPGAAVNLDLVEELEKGAATRAEATRIRQLPGGGLA